MPEQEPDLARELRAIGETVRRIGSLLGIGSPEALHEAEALGAEVIDRLSRLTRSELQGKADFRNTAAQLQMQVRQVLGLAEGGQQFVAACLERTGIAFSGYDSDGGAITITSARSTGDWQG